jgi:hypothetical protein
MFCLENCKNSEHKIPEVKSPLPTAKLFQAIASTQHPQTLNGNNFCVSCNNTKVSAITQLGTDGTRLETENSATDTARLRLNIHRIQNQTENRTFPQRQSLSVGEGHMHLLPALQHTFLHRGAFIRLEGQGKKK